MRGLIFVALAACGSSQAPAPVSTSMQPVIQNQGPPCTEAAAGLERATQDLRPPDTSIAEAMRARCREDIWPSEAIACFAQLATSDAALATCVQQLPEGSRAALFDELTTGTPDPHVALQVAQMKLGGLHVGVPECDLFVSAVADLMHCEQLPIETRIQLGDETADMWALPTHGLPADALLRLASRCNNSLASLRQQATTQGCPTP
jgi:hypothetical protein